VELQTHLSEFNKRGLNLAAISYDSPQILASFAARRAITFPLLSDSNSTVIRAFGIFNETIPVASSARGVPHPGVYVLDSSNKVTAKYFEDNYAERVTASDILVRQFGAMPAPSAPSETQRLRISPSVSGRTAVGGQKLALVLDIEIRRGLHITAPPRWEMTPKHLFTDVAWPPSKTLHIKSLNENMAVYEKRLKLIREVTIPSDESLRAATNAQGVMTLEGAFKYQACDSKTCYPAESVPIQFQIRILRHDTQRY
jgi:hypothetical protein